MTAWLPPAHAEMRDLLGETVGDIDAWKDEDGLREECGVVGVMGVDDASSVSALALHALQHRGQEGCGVSVFSGEKFVTRRRTGLVGDSFFEPALRSQMPGSQAVGHVRYSTQGASVERNLQPLYADLDVGGFAIAHNGNLTNARSLRQRLVHNGSRFQTESDTEVILDLLARSRSGDAVTRFCDALQEIEGGFALVGMTQDALIGARDPIGIRPLVLGRLGEGWMLASETIAFDMVGATYVRDVAPGEVVVIDRATCQVRTVQAGRPGRPRTCAFEYIYFAHPNSTIDGVSVYHARKRMGVQLARHNLPDADIVVPVPDSGMPAAVGFSAESGIPLELGIMRSHFVGRTFIAPGQDARDMKVRLKHRANTAALKDKRVILLDDSIVRGTTSTKIVKMVRAAGAREVHFRSASPRIRYPDFYGINLSDEGSLLAAKIEDNAEMARELGADSVDFLPLDLLYEAILEAPRNPDAPQLAEHYFTGRYPDERRDLANVSTRQLSLLEVG